jgi:hypothetical protein
LVPTCVEIAFYITLLKEKVKRREEDEEDISIYWMALKQR